MAIYQIADIVLVHGDGKESAMPLLYKDRECLKYDRFSFPMKSQLDPNMYDVLYFYDEENERVYLNSEGTFQKMIDRQLSLQSNGVVLKLYGPNIVNADYPAGWPVPPSIIFLPCAHLVCCAKCAKTWCLEQQQPCPTCRTQVITLYVDR